MLDNNIIAQICAVIGAIIMLVVFIASMVPSREFDKDFDHPNLLRATFIIMLIGLLRGAF